MMESAGFFAMDIQRAIGGMTHLLSLVYIVNDDLRETNNLVSPHNRALSLILCPGALGKTL